jgi:cholesterol transport system auxiliary component
VSIRRNARLGAAMIGLAGLGGCVTLFPKAAPAQLYRFEARMPAQAQPTTDARPGFAVRFGAVDFDPAARGQRILTARGSEVAYISDSRWAIPAEDLFDQAIEHGFDAAGGPAQLAGRAQSSTAKDRLSVDVTRFEVDYGAGAAPTIVVRLHAELTREADLSDIGAKEFESKIPASANRVGAIVAAFDDAVTQVVGDLVSWVETAGA